MANTIVWADIPVEDIERARRFYGQLLQEEVQVMPGQADIALLGTGVGGVSADLAKTNAKPSSDAGATVYFDSKGDIEGMVRRAEQAGGKVLQEPRDMGPMVGTIAFVLDSEGNRIGIQQPTPQK